MKKGHYGEYTGNARHSRKQEMIHDRELIYDAKTQIHHEDEKYKHTGKDGYKQDMIHERELIHDTKTQLHHADQDYKSSGPHKEEYQLGDVFRNPGLLDNRVETIKESSDKLKGATSSVVTSLTDAAEKKKKSKSEENVDASDDDPTAFIATYGEM